MVDGLNGEENVTTADGIAFVKVFGRLLGCFFDPAARGKVLIGVRFGADFR